MGTPTNEHIILIGTTQTFGVFFTANGTVQSGVVEEDGKKEGQPCKRCIEVG